MGLRRLANFAQLIDFVWMRLALFILMLSLGNAVAESASIKSLDRTSNWFLSYDERSCDLAATFGKGADQIIAMFSRYGPSDGFVLTLSGAQFKTSGLSSDVTVDFGPIENPVRQRGLNGTVGTISSIIISGLRLDDAEPQDDNSQMPSISEDYERKVDTVTFVLPRKRVLKLHLSSMAKPMQTMRTCTDGLMKEWGFNPEEQKASISGPGPSKNPRSWLNSSDYPSGMLGNGQSAIVHYRLNVSEQGSVTACKSYTSEKVSEFGKITCGLLSRRAHFSPALGRDGKAMPSFFIGTVNWLVQSP